MISDTTPNQIDADARANGELCELNGAMQSCRAWADAFGDLWLLEEVFHDLLDWTRGARGIA